MYRPCKIDEKAVGLLGNEDKPYVHSQKFWKFRGNLIEVFRILYQTYNAQLGRQWRCCLTAPNTWSSPDLQCCLGGVVHSPFDRVSPWMPTPSNLMYRWWGSGQSGNGREKLMREWDWSALCYGDPSTIPLHLQEVYENLEEQTNGCRDIKKKRWYTPKCCLFLWCWVRTLGYYIQH